MQITVHAVQFKADGKLVTFIENRINKLEQFDGNIIDGEVYLKLEKNNDIGNKVAEVKLNIPGKELFARRQCKTFEEATDEAVDAIRRQIKKSKGKRLEMH